MVRSLLAISAGASMGAILRWSFGLTLNALFPPIPLGTLAANLLGGYCIGVALSIFGMFPELGAKWNLLVVTGFLGSLTTFSTYSAEVMTLLQQGRFSLAVTAVLIHNIGSVCMVLLGLGSCTLVRTLFQ